MDHDSWLPEHQQHVLYSLAHADDLIARAATVLHRFTDQGTMSLRQDVVGVSVRLTVAATSPIPQVVPRLAADALNQLRSAVEHVVFAEIEQVAGRPLSPQEARSIEMPAAATPDDFDRWLKRGPRKNLAPLQTGADLCERIRALQPFHRQDPVDHPLRVLVEHTNWSKHRTPLVAATLLGAVIPDEPADSLVVSAGTQRPIEAGDVLASMPLGVQVPLNIWPEISILRPHTESWHNLLHELRDLERWVREVALPKLITGACDVAPLPPHLDTTIGYPDFDTAWASAGSTSAATRAAINLQVAVARDGLARAIALHSDGKAHVNAITRWVATLAADEVLRKLVCLQGPDLGQVDAEVRSMIQDATKNS